MSGIRIYACGGTGINITSQVRSLQVIKEAAVPKIVYCDTSTSNLLTGFEKDDKFILSNVNGSGRLRKENAMGIRNAIPELIKEYPPEELNLIVCSASGGTGSTYAIELGKTLLADGHPTIIHLVVTSEDARATLNSMQTIKQFNHIATTLNIPVLLDIANQAESTDSPTVDTEVLRKIAATLMVGSGLNAGLDVRDVSNFVYFNRVTSIEPRLLECSVNFGEPSDDLMLSEDIVTLLDVSPHGALPSNVDSLYRASGVSAGDTRIMLLTRPGTFAARISALESRHNKLTQLANSLQEPALAVGNESADDFYE